MSDQITMVKLTDKEKRELAHFYRSMISNDEISEIAITFKNTKWTDNHVERTADLDSPYALVKADGEVIFKDVANELELVTSLDELDIDVLTLDERKDVVNSILNIIDKNVLYYDVLKTLIENFKVDIDLEKSDKEGSLYNDIQDILISISDVDLIEYSREFDGLDIEQEITSMDI